MCLSWDGDSVIVWEEAETFVSYINFTVAESLDVSAPFHTLELRD